MNQTPETQKSIANTKLDLNHIDADALHIVEVLQRRGFTTYLVGGCVRDLLLKKQPKDFDIATMAHPPEVRQAVRNSFIIGKRFRLVLVKRGPIQYEVSTFRRDLSTLTEDENAPTGDNLFGSPEEDARRRDFTINALFYDPVHDELIDYAKGLPDLEMGLVRMIGDPNVRLLEDPIRIMRAIRLAHMIRFSLDSDLKAAIQSHSDSLIGTALPRRREEFLKFLRLENPALAFLTSMDLGTLKTISPSINKLLGDSAQLELFTSYLTHFHDKELSSPTELFAGLILSVYLTLHQGEFTKKVNAHEILNHPLIAPLMRDELGMFKSEQLMVAKALHLMTLFLKKNEFELRGERRRKAFVGNESFPLALKLSEREHWLSGQDLHFWQEELTKHTQEGGSKPRPNRNKRRRRPPRPPRK